MKHIKRRLLILLSICFITMDSTYLLSIEKGSNTLPSLEPYFVFPNTDSDNAILSFAFFNAGFALQDATTTCSFYSVFSAGGNILLNGGLLSLATDFYFDPTSTYSTCGTINANNNNIYFSPTISSIGEPVNEAVFVDTHINLAFDLTVAGTWRFQGFSCIHGGGNALDLTSGGSIFVDVGSAVYFKDVTLKGLAGTNLACLDNQGTIIFDDVIIELTDNVTFSVGSMSFCNECQLVGSSLFSYESIMSTTISSRSSLTLDEGITFSYNPASGAQDLIVFESASSQLILRNATLHAAPTGLLLTTGSMIVADNAHFSSDVLISTTLIDPINMIKIQIILNEGIIWGTGNQKDDFSCVIHKGCQLLIDPGSVFVYNNVSSTALSMDGIAAQIAVASGASMRLYTSLDVTGYQVILNDGSLLLLYSGVVLKGNIVPIGSAQVIRSWI